MDTVISFPETVDQDEMIFWFIGQLPVDVEWLRDPPNS